MRVSSQISNLLCLAPVSTRIRRQKWEKLCWRANAGSTNPSSRRQRECAHSPCLWEPHRHGQRCMTADRRALEPTKPETLHGQRYRRSCSETPGGAAPQPSGSRPPVGDPQLENTDTKEAGMKALNPKSWLPQPGNTTRGRNPHGICPGRPS